MTTLGDEYAIALNYAELRVEGGEIFLPWSSPLEWRSDPTPLDCSAQKIRFSSAHKHGGPTILLLSWSFAQAHKEGAIYQVDGEAGWERVKSCENSEL